MILTVTCNPAVDVTYHVDELRHDGVHRVREVRRRPGGKGVNVATVLHQLGEPVTALGIADDDFAGRVREAGPAASFVPAMTEVRRTVVATDGDATTSFWEPGTPVPEGTVDELVALVRDALTGATALVVSGSLPPGVGPGTPARLAALARQAGVPVVLDVDGEPLRLAVEAGGAVLMPNLDELARLVGDPAHPDREVAALALRTGAPVVATLGAEGLVASDGQQTWRVPAPEQVTGNPTGAGDATAAGVARGLAAGHPWPQVLADAVALGSAAVLRPVAGEVDLDAYRRWREPTRATG